MADLDAIREALERLTLLITGEISEDEYQRLRREALELLDGTEADTTAQQDTALAGPAMGYELARRYRVEERIGSGGLGVIYRVTDTQLEEKLAAKLLPPMLIDNPQAMELLKREVRNTRGLSHRNICRVINLETDDALQTSFVLMELLEGANLRQVLAEHGRLPEEQVFEIARQVYAALERAHDEDIVHRDIKPENLFWVGYEPGQPIVQPIVQQKVQQKVQIKVLDFGISERVKDSVARLTGFTRAGTAAYVSPEVLANQAVGPAGDVYALGVTLYELAEGEPPFTGPNDSVVFELHRTAEPREGKHCPRLWPLIDACLSKQPGVRPLRWRQALAVLEKAGQERQEAEVARRAEERRRRDAEMVEAARKAEVQRCRKALDGEARRRGDETARPDNAWEWVRDARGSYEGDVVVVRGGSWDSNPRNLRCSVLLRFWPNDRRIIIGFRCVLDDIP